MWHPNGEHQLGADQSLEWNIFLKSGLVYVGNISNIGFFSLPRTVKFYFKTSTGSWNLWSAEVEFLVNNLLQLFVVNLNKYESLY